MTHDLLAVHEERFRAFAAPYVGETRRNAGPMRLKLEHSLQVLENARAITAREVRGEPLATTCLLAALYHDLGRFPQYERWATFRDADSANHARLGVLHLRRTGLLRDLDPAMRKQVLTAVILHNRLALPAAISPQVRTAADVVRDADKLDIMRVMLGHFTAGADNDPVVVLNVADDPDRWTDTILDEVLAKRPGDYRRMRFVNDFVILICGWAWALEFSASRDLLRQRNLVGDLLGLLPRVQAMDKLRASLAAFVRDPR